MTERQSRASRPTNDAERRNRTSIQQNVDSTERRFNRTSIQQNVNSTERRFNRTLIQQNVVEHRGRTSE